MLYTVSWTIDIEADTPGEAAEIALDYQRNEGMVFDVFAAGKKVAKIDLSFPEESVIYER